MNENNSIEGIRNYGGTLMFFHVCPLRKILTADVRTKRPTRKNNKRSLCLVFIWRSFRFLDVFGWYGYRIIILLIRWQGEYFYTVTTSARSRTGSKRLNRYRKSVSLKKKKNIYKYKYADTAYGEQLRNFTATILL